MTGIEGESQDSLLEELLKPEYYLPLEPRQIQLLIQIDPGGDFLNFWEWMSALEDTPKAVSLVNNSPTYRLYLDTGVSFQLKQINFARFSDEALLFYLGIGANNFLTLKKYCDWQNFKYPQAPLPLKFVNDKIINPNISTPLETYWFVIFSICLADFALYELRERAQKHPELEGFLDYHTATNPEIRNLAQQIAPNGFKFSNMDEAWRKLSEVPKIKHGLNRLGTGFTDIFTLKSVNDNDTVTNESRVEAEEKLLNNVNEKKAKAYEALIQGLRGYLGNTLLRMTRNDMVDSANKERKHRSREVTESRMDAQLEAHGKDVDTPFLDTRPSPEPTPEELILLKDPIDLEKLGFNIAELTTGEITFLLDELNDAVSRGYGRYSKEDLSLSQYWNKESDPKLYERKMKMLRRLEVKRKKP